MRQLISARWWEVDRRRDGRIGSCRYGAGQVGWRQARQRCRTNRHSVSVGTVALSVVRISTRLAVRSICSVFQTLWNVINRVKWSYCANKCGARDPYSCNLLTGAKGLCGSCSVVGRTVSIGRRSRRRWSCWHCTKCRAVRTQVRRCLS